MPKSKHTNANSQQPILASHSAGEPTQAPIITTPSAAKNTTRTPDPIEHDDLFDPQHEFTDEIHGQILLSTVERDLVDTPEFQRLFRVSQLGLVDLVYQTGNHTRGAHSIGTCHVAGKLIAKLKYNNGRLKKFPEAPKDIPEITYPETILIRLGGLLHDLSHGPFSHDIEKKTHYIFPHDRRQRIKVVSHHGPYRKHDDWKANPALYITIFNRKPSVLARVLRAYSPRFWNILQTHPRHGAFVKEAKKWKDVEHELLPALLFHLLAYEKIEEAVQTPYTPLKVQETFDTPPNNDDVEWGLGGNTAAPEARAKLHELWYQPYRHDIIGDTLSADLIDYIARDTRHLGMAGGLDENLLRFYVLARTNVNEQGDKLPLHTGLLYRCAIELWDYKRGTIRSERINDVFRLLDLRHEIHEKAVFHRVVQSGIAMIARSIQLLPQKPPVAELYRLGKTDVALAGDDHFLRLLHSANGDESALPTKLVERRIYRPLIIIPGDRVTELLSGTSFPHRRLLAGAPKELPDETGYGLRELAAITDSRAFADFTAAVSYWIEQLLEHRAATAEEQGDRARYNIKTLLANAIADRAYRRALRNQRPQRVIIWTIPYKQLYKDPSLLVAAKTQAHSIELLAQMDPVPQEFRGVHKRIKAGVDDSEQKYESLWKLYVFLSDGLFFSGPYAKILPGITCREAPQHHEQHLHEAKHIVTRALRAMWQYWSAKRKTLTTNELGAWLDDTMKDDEFIELLLMLKVEWDQAPIMHTDEQSDTATLVDVTQYLHGAYVEGEPSNCRDARYKHAPQQRLQPNHELFPYLIDKEVEFCGSEINRLSKELTPELRIALTEQARTATAAGPQRELGTGPAADTTTYVNLIREHLLRIP